MAQRGSRKFAINGTVIDAPIFDAADPDLAVERFVEDGAVGASSLVSPADSNIPQVRYAVNGSVYALHDAASVASGSYPFSPDHHYTFEDNGDTTTLTDQAGSLDGTINGSPTYTTGSLVGTYALDYDSSTPDYVDFGTGLISDRTSDFTYVTHINLDSLGSDDRIIDLRGDMQHILNVGRSGADTLGLFMNGSDNPIQTISAGTTYAILVEHDSSVPEVTVEVDGTQQLTVPSSPDSGGTSNNRFFSNVSSVGNNPDGRQDETLFYSRLLSSSEKSTIFSQ